MLRPGYDVQIGDVTVGRTTSGSMGFSIGEMPIGLAYIDAEHAGADSVDVMIRGRAVPARVVTKPFYRRAS
jgi:glycine cleavage system aminomethyltransferase T